MSKEQDRYKQAIKDDREGKPLDLSEDEFELYHSIKNLGIEQSASIVRAETLKEVGNILGKNLKEYVGDSGDVTYVPTRDVEALKQGRVPEE